MTTRKMLTQLSDNHATASKVGSWLFWLAVFVATLAAGRQAHAAVQCDQTITADVVVFDSPTVFNRLGAQNPNWITYALRRDTVYVDWGSCDRPEGCSSDHLKPLTQVNKSPDLLLGHVELRPDKRPRPLVLRSVAGSCLTINFQNLLTVDANPGDPTPGGLFNDDQVAGRCAGIHAQGVELISTSTDDGSFVGRNSPNAQVNLNCSGPEKVAGLVGPGGDIQYKLYTPHEGAFIFNNYGAQLGSEANAGNTAVGMFGALNVQPKGARIYRSQVTEEELRLATVGYVGSNCAAAGADEYYYDNPMTPHVFDDAGNYVKGDESRDNLTPEKVREIGEVAGVHCHLGGQPIIDYEALYPVTIEPSVWDAEGKAGLPVLNMLTGRGCKSDTSEETSGYEADGRCAAGSHPLNELVHSDINAIIAGPDPDGSWRTACAGASATTPKSECPYPLESVGKNNPQLPNRLEAFREFTSQFHDEQTNSQVFPRWYEDPVLGYTLAGVKDAFMINYGSGGIGSEIIANRLHTGPMHDCTDCAYEEFFLSSSTVGDPAVLVEYPANTGIEQCDPHAIDGESCWRDPVRLANGPVAFPQRDEFGEIVLDANLNPIMNRVDNYALYQEDPSNVHHSYINDFTKVRNTHAGSFEQHIFHLHNHQWLFNPNDDNANYLDAQEVMPGSGHTYELVNGGVGNRNRTSGDAIFHCHFYPHFAQGMWYHIRIMDVFEEGTKLAVSIEDDANGDGYHDTRWGLRSGKPAPGSRAHADGELTDGIPIPAIVPLPGRGMAPMPAKVQVAGVDRGDYSLLGGRTKPDGSTPDSSQAFVDWTSVKGADGLAGTPDDVSPGYPFTIAGYECGFEYNADGTKVPANAATGFCPQGVVGQRFPTPPLDMLTQQGALDITMTDAGGDWDNNLWAHVDKRQAGGFNGGLPRHALLGYTSGGFSKDTQNRLDFQKVVELARPVYYPEIGTELEHVNMRWHSAARARPSMAQQLGAAPVDKGFQMNGSLPVPGGPFQDPCVDDEGEMLGTAGVGDWYDGDGDESTLGTKGASEFTGYNPRTYRVANIQIDAVFNKVGYHYPQERIISLWGDVDDHVAKRRPPEPLVMRFNTFDCGKILHANLVPHEYEIDDFQVRTPTDIIGQHIHLPKWDLTTNDGAANGWNYEDGALAPGMVRERIAAINEFNHIIEAGGTTTVGELHADKGFPLKNHPLAAVPIDLSDLKVVKTIPSGDTGADLLVPPGTKTLEAKPHPFFSQSSNPQAMAKMYLGARTVIQRLLVDPVMNVDGVDRGLGLTFSHDHYGPSTFQQIGLYSTILAEPAGSTWKHNESGDDLYGREIAATDCLANCTDGGPTTWQAAIFTPASAPNENQPDNTPNPLFNNVKAETIPSHREFYFEMSDFQHAYEPGVYVGADADGVPLHHDIIQPDPFNATVAVVPELQDTWRKAINPPLKLKSVPFPDIVTANHLCPGPQQAVDPDTNKPMFETRKDPATCDANNVCDVFRDPTTNEPIQFAVAAAPVNGEVHATNVSPLVPRPCVEAINISHSSMWVVNYRNEPVGLRVFDPNKIGPDGKKGAQADGMAGDLALAFQSRGDRAISELNDPLGNTPYPAAPYCSVSSGDLINCDRRRGDPFTPIMRAHENDHIKIKVQVGATEEQHQTSFHGLKWLSNGSGFGRSPNSGWRNFQSHGISEQFSLQMPILPDRNQRGSSVDYFYGQDVTRDGIWSGTWGIIRSYTNKQSDLVELPSNAMTGDIKFVNDSSFSGVCPTVQMDQDGNPLKVGKGKSASTIPVPVRNYTVYAVLANDVLPYNPLVTIPSNEPTGPRAPGVFVNDNEGGTLDPNGGTLVYNRRTTTIPMGLVDAETGEQLDWGSGPLNDPTAMMYVLEEDLEPRFIKGVSPDEIGWKKIDGVWKYGPDDVDDRCQTVKTNPGEWNPNIWTKGCPVKLRAGAPVEPVVLRANAGECVEVTLHNKLTDQAMAHKVYGDPEDIDRRIFSCDNGGTGYCSGALGIEIFDERLGKQQLDGGKVLARADGKIVAYNEAEALAKIDFDHVPDLAGWQDLFWVVNRDLGQEVRPPEMHFFNNNLVRPSNMVGLHAQLVEYDASRDDGLVVGYNPQSMLAFPGSQHTYRYYAGHIEAKYLGETTKGKNTYRNFARVATPVEFGGTNLLSADRIKQPQKGLYGALVIEPEKATYSMDTEVADGQGSGMDKRWTRAQMTIVSPEGEAGSGGTYREAVSIGFRIANLRWSDGRAITNIHQGELGREGAEDSGHAGFNYGTEPSWFRFKLPPDAPFGNAKTAGSFGEIPNVHAFFANGLTTGEMNNYVPENGIISAMGDPATPVFRTTAGTPTRMHVLNGASADRDATFVLHGHVWQRDPFVCPGDKWHGLLGLCDPSKVASRALGLNPIGKYMGGEEGMGHVYGHWPILFDAGGSNGVAADYLFRDYAPSGSRNGMFGILRVE
ncbi:MAG TPA: hypothetical protein VIS31_14660 [Woeseiaceae bacterium]